MSPRSAASSGSARVFAALGDETRLRLVERLSRGGPASMGKLAEGSDVSRQAIAKHLGVLEDAGLVRSRRSGRSNVYRLETHRLLIAQGFLDRMSQRWDSALNRLRDLVEG